MTLYLRKAWARTTCEFCQALVEGRKGTGVSLAGSPLWERGWCGPCGMKRMTAALRELYDVHEIREAVYNATIYNENPLLRFMEMMTAMATFDGAELRVPKP